MGYTTSFTGSFQLNKKLDERLHDYLVKFNQVTHVKRNVDPKYGVEGEFYIGGQSEYGRHPVGTIDRNCPPSTQPSIWCNWVPSEDGHSIEWDGAEKFYNYIEWLDYIILNFLEPNGYSLTGLVEWQGEDAEDRGRIKVENNVIFVIGVEIKYSEPELFSSSSQLNRVAIKFLLPEES